jgi:tRNA A-37 threonylcarbamoyl transferase component Bud32
VNSERYSQVKQLFLEAIKLPQADRAAFLADVCAGDSELRLDVEELLKHDSSQTIIQHADSTVVGVVRGEATRPSLLNRLRQARLVSKYLRPRAYLAIGAFLATPLLLVIAFLIDYSVASFQDQLRRAVFRETLDAKVMGLETWMASEKTVVESWCRSGRLRELGEQLVRQATAPGSLDSDLARSPLQEQLQEELRAIAGTDVKYAVWDRRFVTIADWSSDHSVIGKGVTRNGATVLSATFDGELQLLHLGTNDLITKDYPARLAKPKIAVIAPFRDTKGTVIAALMVYDLPRFQIVNKILRAAQLSESSETYAFNKDGLMLSESRFNDQLRALGLISKQPDSHSSKVVVLRDPGGDLMAGHRPKEAISTQPLTKMARHAISGQDGVDLEGYRNYLGVRVVGAWRWLDDFGFGIATEVRADEMEPGLKAFVIGAWIGFGILAASVVVTVSSFYSIQRLRRQVGKHHSVGQHTLEEQIGEGGMGKVFKARHASLKRPTAVKLLRPELLDQESVSRFAREAQLASQLSHPNTIDIYDYGVTADGLFYFVMEYIEGLSLMQLVQSSGPLPAGRAVYLLKQVCDSLREAHAIGLVHHDIKPQNIMVFSPGGKPDVVKVLDFGLAKHADTSKSRQITKSGMLAGTPGYIAPERLQNAKGADARGDIYSVGAVAFYMLTGREVFQGDSVAEILLEVVSKPATRPSAYVELPPALDQLVVDCLAKTPDQRPQNMAELLSLLDHVDGLEPWTEDQARQSWQDFAEQRESASAKK